MAKRYGWVKWADDPWGNSRKFAEWEEAVKDDEFAIWAVNETLGGRFYLALGYLLLLPQLDYSKMTPKELVFYEGIGAENFLLIKGYSGWEGFYYPKEPLPLGYINEEIIKLYLQRPFSMYREVVFSIYNWFYVSGELTKRIAEHPELEGLLAYANAKHPEIRKLTRALAPKNFHLNDEKEGWGKFERAMIEQLKRVVRKYNDIFTLSSEVEGNVLKESDVAGQEGLFEAARYWMEKDFITAGLKGRLVPGLLKIVKDDLIDTTRNEKRHRKHETTESQIDTQRKAEGEEVAAHFLDALPGQELGQHDWEIEEQKEKVRELFAKAGLTKTERLVAELRIEEYDYEDIADRISQAQNKQINATTVRKHWSNAKKKLAKILEK